MDDPPDVETLVAGLVANSESARKYAVFKLQGLLADPSFADAFIQGDGLPALRECVLVANGNAQAYALGSLMVLLELDMGWEIVDEEVVEKVSCHMRALRGVRIGGWELGGWRVGKICFGRWNCTRILEGCY